MIRLVLLVWLIAGIALAVAAISTALRSFASGNNGTSGDTMPKTFSTIAYVLLIILMFGVVTGWLGAA